MSRLLSLFVLNHVKYLKNHFFPKIKLKKPKILPHHLGDRLGIHDQSVVSLPPFALRRHTVVVLYDPSEKINKIKLYNFYNFQIHFSINISFNFYPKRKIFNNEIKCFDHLGTYKFLKNLIRQQKLSGHPKQFMITFDLIIEDHHF